MRRLRRAALVLALWAVAPAPARADTTAATPFIGITFAAKSSFLPLDLDPLSKNVTFGGNWLWLSDRVLGIEGEVAFAPGFFEGSNRNNLVTSGHVTTLFGSVITALPLAVTREGLRPYVIGGVGLIRVSYDDQIGLVNTFATVSASSVGTASSDNVPGMQLGGGAIGFVNNRLGMRFDLRYLRSLERGTDELTLERRSKLSFWRATVGVAIRY